MSVPTKRRRIAPAPVSQEEREEQEQQQQRQNAQERFRLKTVLLAEQKSFKDVGCEKEVTALLKSLGYNVADQKRHEKMVSAAAKRAASTSASDKREYQAMSGRSYVRVWNATIVDDDGAERAVLLCRNCKAYYQYHKRYVPGKNGRPKKQGQQQQEEKERTCERCGNPHGGHTNNSAAGFVDV